MWNELLIPLDGMSVTRNESCPLYLLTAYIILDERNENYEGDDESEDDITVEVK